MENLIANALGLNGSNFDANFTSILVSNMDIDSDKLLSFKEVQAVFQSLKLNATEESIYNFMVATDVNKDGNVTLAEFTDIFKPSSASNSWKDSLVPESLVDPLGANDSTNMVNGSSSGSGRRLLE